MLVSGSSLDLRGGSITGSSAPLGGGMHIEGTTATVEVSNVDVSSCSADYGGAISTSIIGRLDVANSSFNGCMAAVQGGAIKSEAAVGTFINLSLADCIVDAPPTQVCMTLNK